eukprot:CAMPEP_0183434892 /NCGR_PEP_ID=MMETSP0370-20130417/65297_1 /TAXON_ID=268820 /ORGANISM="Peridinium aciculiferum, Strain PAER-2" /LENGTH=188 /DNA_ID=CAMNT_0025621735 /DNA_START=132 /DNA_END=695 /DNA_ORIENTATION=-
MDPRRGRPTIYDKPLTKNRGEASLSAFAFMFSEVVDYCLKKANDMQELEERLHELGVPVGMRVLDLYCCRENRNKRETRILPMLNFIAQIVWKQLFGHQADLLKGADHENEYMLNDKTLLVNRFISVPRDYPVNCGAYVAGIVEGVLRSAEFPAAASAHTVDEPGGGTSTTILVRFEESVMARERRLE